ncbi:hypothetical protein SOVF_108730 [Spinacia oleracea]|nr:hypothetical protein SOVF_108730 [Spinacia oleracea]
MMRWSPPIRSEGGLGLAAFSYIAIDYLREISPTWHSRLQPALWSILSLIALSRIFTYKHWSSEFRAALPFLGSIIFLLCALLYEALSVRSVTAVLGLDWHRNIPPLPDTGQWLLLALNEKLPQTVVDILRAHIVGLHHFLMLFIMLAFSVLFGSVKAPGFGLGTRYLFTMAIGRLLRAISFASTILPSARPWCASARFQVPGHPHRWAQKFYVPYASDANAIRQLLNKDFAYADSGKLLGDYRPDWGSMSFLIDFLRPTPGEGSSWFHLLKKAGGGCNDLLYSGHMLVAVLTAMAWTEAYGGFSSALVWVLVLHSAQREIRERHHYSVDCIVAIYVGYLLWKMTGFIWSAQDVSRKKRLNKLEKIQGKLIQAAKDSDIEEVQKLLNQVELGSQENQGGGGGGVSNKVMWLFPLVTTFSTFIIIILAFTHTSDG